MQFLVGLGWTRMWYVKSHFQFLCSVVPSRYFLWCNCDGWELQTLLLKTAHWSQLTFILIYFLPCESSVCKSWSFVLIDLILPLRSFHLTVESLGNPANVVSGKNVEAMLVIIWSETNITTWSWNLKINSICRCCLGFSLEKLECFFFLPSVSLKYEAVKIKCIMRKLLVRFFFWKRFILRGLIWNLYKDTCFLKFFLHRFCMHSVAQDCSKILCRSSFSGTCSLVD